jgi:type I restriction enzyme S subunit
VIGPRLKDLGRWFSGGTPPSERAGYWDGDVPWLSGKDFDKTVLREPTKFTTEEGAALHSRLMPGGQSVLFLVRGMALAHGLPVARLPFDAAINQDVRGLVLRPEFDPGFVYYALVGRRAELNAHIDRAAHGTARLLEAVYSHRIAWMPELAAQRVIADFLERQFERIAEAIRLAGMACGRVSGLEQQKLIALFGRLPNAKLAFRFEVQLGKMLDEKRNVDGDDVPYLRNANVQWGRIDTGDLRRMTFSAADKAKYSLRPGDLLVCEGGDVGRAAVWSGEVDGCYYQKALHRVRPLAGDTTEYLRCCLRYIALTRGFGTDTTGSAIPHLPAERLRELRIPMADPEAQKTIVAEMTAYEETASRAGTLGQEVVDALAAYRSSLIHEAVTGKLDVTKVSDRQMDERLHAAAENRLDEVPV